MSTHVSARTRMSTPPSAGPSARAGQIIVDPAPRRRLIRTAEQIARDVEAYNQALLAARARRNGGRTPLPPVECGSERGYHAHRRKGEETCAPCRAAHARYQRENASVHAILAARRA